MARYVFFFNDTATTEIYTLALHDALPICSRWSASATRRSAGSSTRRSNAGSSTIPSCRTETRSSTGCVGTHRSEEHTSELQSRQYLVCRLLLEKKQRGHVSEWPAGGGAAA